MKIAPPGWISMHFSPERVIVDTGSFSHGLVAKAYNISGYAVNIFPLHFHYCGKV